MGNFSSGYVTRGLRRVINLKIRYLQFSLREGWVSVSDELILCVSEVIAPTVGQYDEEFVRDLVDIDSVF